MSLGDSLTSRCTIDGCERALRARGWCSTHYARWQRHGDPIGNGDRVIRSAVCTVPGCENLHKAQGFCPKHWERWRRHGDPHHVLKSAAARGEVCAVADCGDLVDVRGWCTKHYARWKKHGDPLKLVLQPRSGTCDVPDCNKPSPSMRYCGMHNERLKRNGHFERQNRTRHMHSEGYVIVKRVGHPLADSEGWLYEHRAVLYDVIGPGAHPCNWCGKTVSWDLTYPVHADALVVDHVDAVKNNNSLANLVPSCQPCNTARSNRWVRKRRREAAVR